MRLSEFMLLNENQKKAAVLHQGVLIGKRTVPNRMIFLFDLESFYVETWCNQLNKSVEEYRIFDGVEQLDPYIEGIRIDELIGP